MSTPESAPTADPDTDPDPDTERGAQRRVLFGTLAGTAVEWYDFSIYGFLGVVLAHQFFPSGDATAGLLGAYVSFALAYAVRPVAGVVVGLVADRTGRRGALSSIILLTGLSTFAIGLVPGYAQIGVAAPVLVVALRLLQGVGAGAEWTLGATFLLESSPRDRWPVLGSYVSVTYYVSLIAGTGLATALAAMLGPAFDVWGWRILFLLAAPMALVGRYLRRRVDESPAFRAMQESRSAGDGAPAPTLGALRTQWRPLLAYVALTAHQRVAQFALSTFVVTSLIDTGLGLTGAFLVATLTYVTSVPMVLLGGRLGRRHGIVFTTGLAVVASVLTAVPTFLLLGTGRFWWVLLAEIVLSFGIVTATGPVAALMVGMFVPEVRGAATALSYNVGTVVFGSTAPLVATMLHGWTGNDLAFAGYVTALSLIGLVALRSCQRFLRAPLPAPGTAGVGSAVLR